MSEGMMTDEYVMRILSVDGAEYEERNGGEGGCLLREISQHYNTQTV